MASTISRPRGDTVMTRQNELGLSDGTRQTGPYRAFSADPGWREAWWWLCIPAGLAVFLIAVSRISPTFYEAWILPEGYGFLELGHFFIPLAGLIIALRLLSRPFVRARAPHAGLLVLAALACLYIAGEEHSWGQHFFQWTTPDYWGELNRQQETNLHNIDDIFDKKPRLLLELGTFVGGLLIPLAALFRPRVRRNRWSVFMPADAMVPVALGALFFKVSAILQNNAWFSAPVYRPAEATESFLYLFILFYLIILARRIGELDSAVAK